MYWSSEKWIENSEQKSNKESVTYKYSEFKTAAAPMGGRCAFQWHFEAFFATIVSTGNERRNARLAPADDAEGLVGEKCADKVVR